jgi:hypothetical protein
MIVVFILGCLVTIVALALVKGNHKEENEPVFKEIDIVEPTVIKRKPGRPKKAKQVNK